MPTLLPNSPVERALRRAFPSAFGRCSVVNLEAMNPGDGGISEQGLGPHFRAYFFLSWLHGFQMRFLPAFVQSHSEACAERPLHLFQAVRPARFLPGTSNTKPSTSHG